MMLLWSGLYPPLRGLMSCGQTRRLKQYHKLQLHNPTTTCWTTDTTSCYKLSLGQTWGQHWGRPFWWRPGAVPWERQTLGQNLGQTLGQTLGLTLGADLGQTLGRSLGLTLGQVHGEGPWVRELVKTQGQDLGEPGGRLGRTGARPFCMRR
uniref:Uncharacterized protein n=1 Tax=Knipowitschia caucasica TaxID=637954 RepID=A0AAV2K7Y5_KNICA